MENIVDNLDEFLNDKDTNKKNESEDCKTEECKIKTKTGIIEKVERKLVIEDGRELLRENLPGFVR